MDIIFSANNNETVLVLPVTPEKMPEVVQPYKNTTFDTVNGELNLIGTRALCEIPLQSFFPVNKNYKFVRPGSEKDGYKYVEFFRKYAGLRVPVRMIWIDGMQELLNMALTIENFTYQINKVKDIEYSVDLKEYPFVKVKQVM